VCCVCVCVLPTSEVRQLDQDYFLMRHLKGLTTAMHDMNFEN